MSSEATDQARLHRWLNRHGILHCHVPNGGWRSAKEAARLRAMGTQAGVPDLLIFDLPPFRPDVRGVALELKRANRQRSLTRQQRVWLAALQARGWLTEVGYGYDDAVAKLQALGYG